MLLITRPYAENLRSPFFLDTIFVPPFFFFADPFPYPFFDSSPFSMVGGTRGA